MDEPYICKDIDEVRRISRSDYCSDCRWTAIPRPSAPEPEGDHTKCQMGAKSCSSCCISEMCEPEAPDAGKELNHREWQLIIKALYILEGQVAGNDLHFEAESEFKKDGGVPGELLSQRIEQRMLHCKTCQGTGVYYNHNSEMGCTDCADWRVVLNGVKLLEAKQPPLDLQAGCDTCRWNEVGHVKCWYCSRNPSTPTDHYEAIQAALDGTKGEAG